MQFTIKSAKLQAMSSSQPISRTFLLAVTLLFSYLIGLIFGGGLHLHESLTHEHAAAYSHEHSWAAHVHETAIVPLATDVSQEISPQKTDHDHVVPVVHLVAVPVSASTATNSPLAMFASLLDVVESSFPHLSISLLFVLPRDTSPPLLAQAGFSDAGRSPPAFS